MTVIVNYILYTVNIGTRLTLYGMYTKILKI